MFIHRLAAIAAATLAAALPASMALALPLTTQSGVSTIRVDGAAIVEQSDARTDGRVSTLATFGTSATPEIRTAARSAVTGELASNVRMDDRIRFSYTNVAETISAATLIYHSAPDNALLRRASLDFMLPPSFMEVTSHGEVPDHRLEMVLFADLRVCFAAICGLGDSKFNFQSILTASWREFTWTALASGDPSLDLDALEQPVITDSQGFQRTVTLEFGAFSGHIDLGLVPAGSPLRVEYQIQTRGSGTLAANIGLAGINDPFQLASDPLRAGALTLSFAPVVGSVGEPAPFALAALALAALAVARARPHRRSR